MTRATLVLVSPEVRQRAARWVAKLPEGTRVDSPRSPSVRYHRTTACGPCLTDIATQLPWHGIKLSPDDWKLLFLDSLKRELRMVPNIDGNGFVNLGRSSSDLGKAEMTDLIDLMHAFGANHGVVFHDQPAMEPA